MEGFHIHERENSTSFLIGLDDTGTRCIRDRAIATTLDRSFPPYERIYIYIYTPTVDRYRGKARKWIETRRRTRRIRATPLQAITLIAVISIATDSPPILAISRELKYRRVRMAGRREPFFFIFCVSIVIEEFWIDF